MAGYRGRSIDDSWVSRLMVFLLLLLCNKGKYFAFQGMLLLRYQVSLKMYVQDKNFIKSEFRSFNKFNILGFF